MTEKRKGIDRRVLYENLQRVTESCFRNIRASDVHIASFNHLLRHGLREIIDETMVIRDHIVDCVYVVHLGNARCGFPYHKHGKYKTRITLTPEMCRAKHIHYEADVVIDVTVFQFEQMSESQQHMLSGASLLDLHRLVKHQKHPHHHQPSTTTPAITATSSDKSEVAAATSHQPPTTFVKGSLIKTLVDIPLFCMPIMVGSIFDVTRRNLSVNNEYDREKDGSFILGTSSYISPPTLDIKNNKPHIFEDKKVKSDCSVSIRSGRHGSRYSSSTRNLDISMKLKGNKTTTVVELSYQGKYELELPTLIMLLGISKSMIVRTIKLLCRGQLTRKMQIQLDGIMITARCQNQYQAFMKLVSISQHSSSKSVGGDARPSPASSSSSATPPSSSPSSSRKRKSLNDETPAAKRNVKSNKGGDLLTSSSSPSLSRKRKSLNDETPAAKRNVKSNKGGNLPTSPSSSASSSPLSTIRSPPRPIIPYSTLVDPHQEYVDRILNTQVLPHIELDVVEMEECRVLARKLQGRGVHRLPMVGMGKCRQQCWVYQTTPTSQSVLQQCIHAAINRKKGVYLCYVLWQMVCTVSPNPKHTQFGFSTKHSPGLCRYKTIGENLGLLVTQMVHDLAQSNEVDIQIHVNCVDEMLKTREKKQVAKQTQPSASFGAVEVPVASGMWRAELKMPILKRVLPLTSTTTSTATGMSNDGVCANPDTFSCMEIESAKEVHNQSIIDLVKVHLKKMSSGINSRLKMAMCTGNWVGKRRQNCTRNGITQVLNESSPQWELSANSKVRHSEKKTGHKSSPPRQVQAEGAGGRCPHETVEGEKCGLVLHLSTGREITNSTDPRLIQMVLLQFMTTDSRISLLTVQQWMSCLYSPPNANAVLVARGSNSVSSSSGSNNTNNIPLDTQTLVRVEINGNLWRWTPTPLLFVRRFQKLRRLGHLDRHASVAYTPHLQLVEIDVRMGRVSAPLFIVSRLCDFIQAAQKQSQNRRWFRQENLMRLGFMDYVDLCERISESVAIDLTDLGRRPWCQYVEVDPSFLASPNVNLLLYRNSAKSARTVLSPIMSRQGIPYKEPWSKIRNANASMVYSFKPLAQSMMGRARPNCQRNGVTLNCGIIMAGVGQTVEDNCTLAQSVVDNWLLHTIHMSTELSIQKRFGSSLRRERFEKPDPETNTLKDACYDKIDKHGLIEPRTPIKTGDVVIGKTGPMGVAVTRKGSMLQDFSSVYKGSDGWVNRVHHLRNKDNLETVRVETACIRKPQVGDKLCSLHGQKVTIGAILPDHEMPFNEHGSLQIIYGSSCLRRKTSQPFEQYLTKAAVLDGKFIDATAFKSQEAWDACIKWAGDVLVKHGRRRDGCEWLTNGATGVRFKNPIFTGPLFVHRLVHMVDKKVHSRNRGPLGPDMQATAGRSSNGGSRIGFMERDTFIAYGCSETIQRLFQLSDQQTQYVCQSCGLFVPPTTRWQRKKKKSCATTAGRGAWGGDGGQDKNKTNELEQVVVFNCTVCGSEEPPHEVKLPYAMVNLNHMIMSVGICPHFITKKKTQSAIDRDQMMPVIY